ncbi:guanylate kinase [Parvularcula bermudensis HTCC2503]|uniref:Guanylate kinase n=1 Tax=Parvularcula bermudensis (strain ATCC BAA-594 / HTCC2503 / KCTC 12087) TaxID=314260 RepID=E0TC34_PARBH|nr:guanylate kinase [Parvularcula bermudensis HTCC2503]
MRMAPIDRRGLMLIVSSPSGAGKTTLSRRLLADDPAIHLSVSATTRPKRSNEIHGKDYFFVDEATFVEQRERGDFLESALVFGNYYGTPRTEVVKAVEAGRDVLFDIDWQGAQQLAEVMPQDLVTVFILPPSRQSLEDRLRSRNQDSEAVVMDRMKKADSEISHYAEYDYVILNDDINRASSELKAILMAERLKRQRQTGLSQFVRSIIGT